MRPLCYSENRAATTGMGWMRCGDEIAYFMNQFPNGVKKPTLKKGSAASAATPDALLGSYYTLTFRLSFTDSDDTVYIAQCYPYTYTMGQRVTTRLLAEKCSSVIRREALCQSYGGNACDLLTVTDFSATSAEITARKVVVISARVHPGETNASWMMQGVLEAVTADSADSRLLRRTVMVNIVPMLNPDGVILGNYRCSVAGVDLNRQWAEPHETNHPTIFHLKHLMRGFVATDQLLLFCDFHGHSRKSNIFAYGCETTRGPQRLRERVFPRLLADCTHFSLESCSFKVLRSKETTGRVVVWRQFATPNSFTLEASLCGPDFGSAAYSHYTIDHLKAMGASFVPALLDFTDPVQSRVNSIVSELEQQYPIVDEDVEEVTRSSGAAKASRACRRKA